MNRILKSDLTYSLMTGFAVGAAALFFTQPAEQQEALGASLSSLIAVISHLVV